MRLISLSDVATYNDTDDIYFLTESNLNSINSEPGWLYVDIPVHIGENLEDEGQDDSLYLVELDDSIQILFQQDGSFILRTNTLVVSELVVNSSIMTPRAVTTYDDDYPGGFFRFQSDPSNLYDSQVIIQGNVSIDVTWFGLPNTADNNAWLLRKAILAASSNDDRCMSSKPLGQKLSYGSGLFSVVVFSC